MEKPVLDKVDKKESLFKELVLSKRLRNGTELATSRHMGAPAEWMEQMQWVLSKAQLCMMDKLTQTQPHGEGREKVDGSEAVSYNALVGTVHYQGGSL